MRSHLHATSAHEVTTAVKVLQLQGMALQLECMMLQAAVNCAPLAIHGTPATVHGAPTAVHGTPITVHGFQLQCMGVLVGSPLTGGHPEFQFAGKTDFLEWRVMEAQVTLLGSGPDARHRGILGLSHS